MSIDDISLVLSLVLGVIGIGGMAVSLYGIARGRRKR